MRRTTIRGIDAADDMRRTLHRSAMRHRRKTHDRLVEGIIVAAVVAGVALGANAWFRHAEASKPLPETQFEQQARIAAAAKKSPSTTKTAGATKSAKKTGGTSAGGGAVASKPAPKSSAPKASSTPKVAAAPKTSTAVPASKSVAGGAMSVSSAGASSIRRIHVAVTAEGFSPTRIEVPFGTQLEFDVDKAPSADVAGFEITAFSLSADNTDGAVKTFVGAPTRGRYEFQSFNRTIAGTLIVK